MTFYDNNGSPLFYSDDNTHLFDFDGEPIAYISGDSIYDYDGNHLGWLDNGWVIDSDGYYLFFSDQASGGPLKPIKSIRPIKGVKSIKPIKGIKSIRPIKPIKSLSWSKIDFNTFFS